MNVAPWWQRFERAKCAPLPVYAAAAAIGAAWTLYLFPLSFLLGSHPFFEQGDPAQHVSGWWFYAQDSWRFPILWTKRLSHPQGTTIAFTDSIPLAALLLKPFAGWLPPTFHYFGLWHLVAYATQAMAAAFLSRVLGYRSLAWTSLAAVFAVSFPALTHRLGHTSLQTHSLILLSLALCIADGRNVGRNVAARAGFATSGELPGSFDLVAT